jgi:hypothetical protein
MSELFVELGVSLPVVFLIDIIALPIAAETNLPDFSIRQLAVGEEEREKHFFDGHTFFISALVNSSAEMTSTARDYT